MAIGQGQYVAIFASTTIPILTSKSLKVISRHNILDIWIGVIEAIRRLLFSFVWFFVDKSSTTDSVCFAFIRLLDLKCVTFGVDLNSAADILSTLTTSFFNLVATFSGVIVIVSEICANSIVCAFDVFVVLFLGTLSANDQLIWLHMKIKQLDSNNYYYCIEQ